MKNKIIIKIRGGLGNQLFQYAYALSVYSVHPEKKVIVDASYFNKKRIRNLELNHLSLAKTIQWSTKRYVVFDFLYFIYRLMDRFFRGRIDKFWQHFQKYGYLFCDKAIEYDIKQNHENFYLAGYFQDESIIRKVRSQIKEGVIPKSKLGKKSNVYYRMIARNKSIGVSIRAGEDYEKFGWPICTRDYYRSGLKEIKTEDKMIFVFSDVINKIRQEDWFYDMSVVYVEGCSNVEELFLLSKCNEFVIANSTFSWWGAYLGEYKSKKVVAPHMFYPYQIMKYGKLHLQDAIYLDNKTGKRV